jgi:diadenosine tetraphosphatase ApaH/serine/threonine PP2A family protein phosphatase
MKIRIISGAVSKSESCNFTQMDALCDIILAVLTSRMYGGQGLALPSHEKILRLIEQCRGVLASEPSVIDVSGAFVVVGDIHGNIDDLIRIFERCGYPPETSYVFLGDCVDRGSHGVEVMLFLFALKIIFPDGITLLRGNHECPSVCTFYGFKGECDRKLGADVFPKIVECFTVLPIAARLNGRVLCVHGGISPDFVTVEQIAALERPLYSFGSPIVTGIVWSDPAARVARFGPSDRGAGAIFGRAALDKFLDTSRLALLIRSHEACVDGYNWPLGAEGRCLTVFSTTNYCGTGNRGAVAQVSEDSEVRFEMFDVLSKTEKRVALIPEWIFHLSRESTVRMIPGDSSDDSDMLSFGRDLDLFADA